MKQLTVKNEHLTSKGKKQLSNVNCQMSNVFGFTLVELLIVVAIIGVLSVVGLTAYSGVQQKARDTKRRADIEEIAKAFAIKYNTKTGQYNTITGADFASGTIPVQPDGSPYLGCTLTECSIATGAITSDGRYFAVSANVGDVIYTQSSSPGLCSNLSALRNGLVGYWDDFSTNSVRDKSGNGHDGSWGGTPSSAAGKVGTAGQFNGTNYVSLGNVFNINSNDSFTLSAWVKKTGAGETRPRILSKRAYAGGGTNKSWYELFINDGSVDSNNDNKLSISYYDNYTDRNVGGVQFSGGTALSLNQWYHAVLVRNTTDDKLSLYIDGVKVSEAVDSTINAISNNANFQISCYLDASSSCFNGLVDEVRIYNRALTADEIRASYNSNAGCSLF